MCFFKTKGSKILNAKKDIVVYKIGEFANKTTFIPYFMDNFTYKTSSVYHTIVHFRNNRISQGFHGYINIIVSFSSSKFAIKVQKNNKCKSLLTRYSVLGQELYLGKFIIPKGATYCVNIFNEIVSNQIIYTGQYANVKEIFDINLKDLWKEK